MLISPEINLLSLSPTLSAELALRMLKPDFHVGFFNTFHFSCVLIASVLNWGGQNSRETSSEAFSNHSITADGLLYGNHTSYH